jgi:sugar lactone lactonase YvrE
MRQMILAVWLGLVMGAVVTGCAGGVDTPSASDLRAPEVIALPGDHFFPESINATADGTLYVSSIATGAVVRVAPGAGVSTFIAGNAVNPADPKGVTGVLPDGPSSTLYLCAVDLSTTPPATELRTYELATGTLKQRYAFSTPAFCNDLALTPTGDLYVSDSFGKVWKLAAGATTLTVWSDDPLLAPPAGGFGANGLALDPTGGLYVGNTFMNWIVRIPIGSDGRAGPAAKLELSATLAFPDGLRIVGNDELVVVEAMGGKVSQIKLGGKTGMVTTLSASVTQPSSLVKVGGNWWVTEGQVLTLLGMGTPTLPFDVRRIPGQ